MLKGRSRAQEHQAVLLEILDVVRREKIDCVLVTGDIFDSPAPSPEAEQLAFNFFSELRGLNVPAIVIGGNHDHPKRLLAIRNVLRFLDIHVRPEPVGPADGGVIEISRNGETAKIGCLPFISVGKVADAVKIMAPEGERYEEYFSQVGQMCEILSSSFNRKSINLLLAHLYIEGGETSKSEREIHVAKPYAVSAQLLPTTAQYIALGHLHRPQELHAPSPTHYAGSILQLDFGEQDQQKRVVIIDAHPGRPATIENCPVAAGRRLRDICGTVEELEAQADTFGDDYLRVTINAEQRLPGIAARIHELLPNALDIHYADSLKEAEEAIEIAGTDPRELFGSFYKSQEGSDPAEALLKLFDTLYEESLNASD